MAETNNVPREIKRVDPPIQFDSPQFSFDIEVDQFLWASQARTAFRVTGKGLTAAVGDSGLRTTHVDFAGKVLAKRNFTTDNGGDPGNVTDLNGHGTNVAGLILANGDHIGIAPDANIVPLKVLSNSGSGSFAWLSNALQWVIDHHEEFNISALCLSLGDGGNYTSDNFSNDDIRDKIRTLHQARVAVAIAAGNDYHAHNSQQGMGYPAIIRDCVSVGAVFDAAEGGFSYASGAIAHSTRAGQITPFSQRLHASVASNTATDIFAPGAPATSAGIQNDHGESTQHGTSQATPVVVGLILLMQQFYKRETGVLPEVDDLVPWLQNGGVVIHDGDDEDDNVQHTNLNFIRVDALSALDAVRRHLQKKRLEEAMA